MSIQSNVVLCPKCKGKGEITYDMPAISETWTCGLCKGDGLVTEKQAAEWLEREAKP